MSTETDESKMVIPKYFRSLDNLMKHDKLDIMTTITLISGILNSDAMIIFCDWLKNNTTLTSLTLTKNQITDDCAALLAEALIVNTTLTTLNLPKNNIGNSGANALFKMLQTNNTITSLYLCDNQISNTGIVSLANNTSLTYLNLINNKIDNAGVVSLVESIKLNKGLTTLDLSYNIIGNSGAAFTTLFEYNSTLLNLYMHNTDITQCVFDAFIDILKMPSFGLKQFTITSINCDLIINQYYHFNYDKLIDAIKYNTTLQEFLFNIVGVDSDLVRLYNKTINEFIDRNKLIEKMYPLICCSHRRGIYLPDEIWTKVVRIC
jgi:Ran GTPase-activating protein (RanGAP) involved in mRNA processing and transport